MGVENISEMLLSLTSRRLDGSGGFLRNDAKSTLCRRQTDVATAIRQQLEKVHTIAAEKVSKLTLATDVQIGLEILHLFILDLLGPASTAGRVFQVKSEEE